MSSSSSESDGIGSPTFLAFASSRKEATDVLASRRQQHQISLHQQRQPHRTLPNTTVRAWPSNSKPPEGCPVCLRTSCMLKTHRNYAGQPTKDRAKIHDDQSYKKLSVPVSIDGGRMTSFLNLPVPLSDTESYRYFHEFFTSQAISITDSRRKPAFDLDFIPVLFQQALKNPATAQTCIAMGATYEAVHGLNLEAPNQKLLAVYARTFQLLRKELDSGQQTKPSEATVVAAINLVMCHGVGFGDVSTLKTHLDGVRALIKEGGGMHNLGSQSITMVLWCDYWNTLFTGKTPSFANESNSRLDISLSASPPAVLGLGFEDLESRNIIPANLLDVCLNTCRLTELLEDKMNNTGTPARWQYFQYKRNTMAMRNGVVYAELFGTASKAECINLAVNLYFLLVLRLVPWKKPLITVCSQLKTALLSSDLSDLWGKDTKALTWVVFMFLAAPDLGKEDRKWALELLLSLLTARYRIKPSSWPAIWRETEREGLMQFVWSNTFLATTFKNACRDVGRIQSSSARGSLNRGSLYP